MGIGASSALRAVYLLPFQPIAYSAEDADYTRSHRRPGRIAYRFQG